MVDRGDRVDRRLHVLVVDDNPALARTLRRALEAEYDVVAVTSALEALELVLRGKRFDAIVCDVLMPCMSGTELHAELARRAPDQATRMLFTTGNASTAAARALCEQEKRTVLEKPFEAEGLIAAVRRVASTDA